MDYDVEAGYLWCPRCCLETLFYCVEPAGRNDMTCAVECDVCAYEWKPGSLTLEQRQAARKRLLAKAKYTDAIARRFNTH